MPAHGRADHEPADAPVVDARALAAEALRLVGIDAAEAEATAAQAVQHARRHQDPTAESMAWRARGLAAREVEQLEVAEQHLRTAVRVGRRAGEQPAAEARMSLALVLAGRGELVAARRTARRAVASLSGHEQARARVQLALIEQRSGALQHALDSYAGALTQLRRYDDRLWEARLRNNRGILRAYRGDVTAADRDLLRAEQLYARLGQDVLAADVSWNRGFVAGLAGDAVAALRLFEDAGQRLERAGVSRGSHFVDRAQVLLSVGLVEEASDVVAAGIADLEARGVNSDAAEARLLLAETFLLAGRLRDAAVAAENAQGQLLAQGRPSLALLAQYTALKATVGDRDAPAWTDGDEVAAALRRAGWHVAATDVLTLAVQRDLAAGRATAPSRMAEVVRATTRGSAGQRVRAWHAVALGRLSVGDRRGALSALRAGLSVHERHRSSMTATELQVRLAGRARDLAELGLRLAVESGRAAQVFGWAERWRAGALSLRPVQPPSDPTLAAQLAVLRAVTVDLERARAQAEPTEQLLRRQRALESRVADLARTSRVEMLQTPQASSRHVQQQLEGRVLLEYLEVDGRLHVLVVDRHSCTVEDVGPVGAVADELEALRFGLRRLSTGGSPRMLAAARSSMHVAAERLDRQLLAPVASSLDGRRLVVVPTGDLHALPWSMLPTLRTTAVSVAPSASVWVAATQQPTTANAAAAAGVTLVAGPGLPGAEAEVRSIGKLYGGHGRVLTGDDAHVEGVLEAMDGAAIAHVAAHGAFRSENALLSTILLHDGALTVYDLERLATAPDLVVLSACESGLSRVQPGNELMGLVAALLRQGTRAMVASVAPMPDDVAHTTMVAFHAGLLAGVAPAEALLTAVNGQPEEDRLRAASFVCFGAG